MNTYDLVNPIMAGNIKTSFEAENPEKAAQSFWEMLTNKKLIVNELHRFMFSLKDKNNNLYHFEIREKEKPDKTVQYEISNITKDVESKTKPTEIKKFMNQVDKVKLQLAGKKKGGSSEKKSKRYKDLEEDSTSSSSSSSDDDFNYSKLRMRNNLISYYWYSPLIYKVKTLFTPVFAQPVAPYVQLWLPMR
jgi:hypothetical protein